MFAAIFGGEEPEPTQEETPTAPTGTEPTEDNATPASITTEVPETTTDPLETVAATVDETPKPEFSGEVDAPVVEAPETITEPVQEKALPVEEVKQPVETSDETSKPAEDKPLGEFLGEVDAPVVGAPETITEPVQEKVLPMEEVKQPVETPDQTSKPAEEKLLGELVGEVDTPVVGAPETITEPVQEDVPLTEDVKQLVEPDPTPLPSSSLPTVAMPMEPKLEPTLSQPEPTNMQPDPKVSPSKEADNSTPLKEEEASSTAPASPEPSIVTSVTSGPTLNSFTGPSPSQQFTGPAPTNLFSGNRGGTAQTSAYSSLSMNECNPTHLAANTALSSESIVRQSRLFSPPTMRSRCGGDRQRLRDEFNTQEIMMRMIFSKFDSDNSGLLDPSELKALLQAHSTAYHIKIDDAVKFILDVADENGDGCLSQLELLPGLQAWHAFNHMPAEVNRALNLAGIRYEGSPLPGSELMGQLLTDLNGFIDVDPEEVTRVRSAALAVGGTEERVTLEQMRMAISVWYTNVERKATTGTAMMEFTLKGWAQSMAEHTRRLTQQLPSIGLTLGMTSDNDLEAPLQEEEAKRRAAPVGNIMPFSENKCSDTTGAILWLILFILPGMFMVHVADDYPSQPECQHDLALLLQWKGYLTLIMGFGGLLYQIVYDGHFRTFCLVAGLLSLVVSFMQAIVGVGYVLASRPEQCGDYLWNVNAFFFVWSLCWGPCLGCFCLCSCSAIFYNQEFQSVSSAEAQAERAARRLVSPSRPVSLE